jgi:hypothetical protein
MPKGTKTLATLFRQLYHRLEGEEIHVGDIPKLDTPLEYLFSGILPHASKGSQRPLPLNTSFSV